MNKEIISTANAPKAIGPYEQAIKVGEFVYASGQIPLDPKTGNLVEGGITIQTRRVMENHKGVVEPAGSSLERVRPERPARDAHGWAPSGSTTRM